MPKPVSAQEPILEVGYCIREMPLGQIYTWTESIVTDTFYTSQKVIPELNSKAILGFGSITHTDGPPSQRRP